MPKGIKGFQKGQHASLKTEFKKGIIGKDSLGWRGGKITLICKTCGKEFKVIFARKNTAKFCSRKCKRHSEKAKKMMSKTRKGELSGALGKHWKVKDTSKMKGRKPSEETTRKRVKAFLETFDKKGRKQYKRYYHFGKSPQYKQWREAVYQRDNWICQNCQKVGGYLVAHHLKSWAKYPELRYKVNNGITLCLQCHKLAHKKKR